MSTHEDFEDCPLQNIIRDGGMMNIFRTIGCIGDSLASGEFEYWDNGQKGYWDFYEYSWGKQIERITGISVTNFSRGGMTAFHMYQEADKQDGPNADIAHLFDPFNLKQGYIIALGVNDLKGKNNLNDLYEGNVGFVLKIIIRMQIRLLAGTQRLSSVFRRCSLTPNFFW